MGKQYILKVYVPGQARSVFRTLQISGRESLDGLADAILKAFCFHDDYYMYEFFMDCRPFSENCYRRYRENEDASSAGIRLDDLDLKKGQNILFHFSFAGDWWFTVHVQKAEEGKECSSPVLLKEKGKLVQFPGLRRARGKDGDQEGEDPKNCGLCQKTDEIFR
jgi:hypothetical protein